MMQQVVLEMPGAPAGQVMATLFPINPCQQTGLQRELHPERIYNVGDLCCDTGIRMYLTPLGNAFWADSSFNSLPWLHDIVNTEKQRAFY